MSSICHQCHASVDGSEKFCYNCGTPIPQALQCQVCQTPSKPGDIYCISCGNSLKISTPTGQFTQELYRKQNKNQKPLIFSSIAMLLVVTLIVGLWKPGLFWRWIDGLPKGGDKATLSNQTELNQSMDFKVKQRKSTTVSLEEPVATIDNVVVDFGEFILSEEEVFTLTSYDAQIYEDGLSIMPYDFKLETASEFEDLVKIQIPYDPKLVDPENEEISVGAKHFNDAEGVWEDVVYSVDSVSKTVNIETSHFSKYSVFMARNEKSRTAYISTVFPPIPSSIQASEILQEYLDNGNKPGPKAEAAGMEAIHDLVNFSDINSFASAAATTKDFQAGALPAFNFEFTSELGSLTRWAGLGVTFYTLASDGVNCKDDHSKREMVTNFTKNIMYNASDFFGTSAIQIGFIGVLAIDYSLTRFGEEAMAQRLKNTQTVYKYYYEKTSAKRDLKEWRRRIIGYIEQNPSAPELAMEMLERDIEDYCNKFWLLPTGEQNALAGEANLRIMSWPNSHDQSLITANYNAQIHKDLYPVYVSVQNYLKNKVHEDTMKKLGKVRDYLNQKIEFTIIDQKDSKDKGVHKDYIIRFEPLAQGVDENTWTGRLNDKGVFRNYFTLLGFLQSGSPNNIYLYKPGDIPGQDKAHMIVPFSVSKPRTEIIIPDMELTFEDILGNYDAAQKVEGFDSALMDDLLDQMQIPEGYEDFFDADAYRSQYNEAMEGANTSNQIGLRIEKIGEDIAKFTMLTSSEGQGMDVVYKGTWNNGRLHLEPAQELAGGSWDLIFKKENGQITCEGKSEYDTDMIAYSFTLTGTKIDD